MILKDFTVYAAAAFPKKTPLTSSNHYHERGYQYYKLCIKIWHDALVEIGGILLEKKSQSSRLT